MKTSQQISQILKTIQSFQIIQCQMHHEKVAVDVEGNPIHNSLDDTLVFDRVNLCDRYLRNKRLGCAHSGVNINFSRLLESVKTVLPQKESQISKIKNHFESIVLNIYTLDHKVGDLQHKLAVCKINSQYHEKEIFTTSIKELTLEHHTLMDALSECKSQIEQLINNELKYCEL